MRVQGKIVSWNDKKGFGFVKPSNGDKDIFIHITELNWKPQIGQNISYIPSSDKNGRPCGKTAMLSGQYLAYERPSSIYVLQILIAFISLLIISAFSILQTSNYWIAPFYLVLSLLTYIAYWLDKSASQSGRWRTAESTLHFFSLIGGWPGALIAQQIFRHKTKKQPFRTIFWLTIFVNIGALYWLYNHNLI